MTPKVPLALRSQDVSISNTVISSFFFFFFLFFGAPALALGCFLVGV